MKHKLAILGLLLLFNVFEVHSQNDFQTTIGTENDDRGNLFRLGDGYLLVGSTIINGAEDIYLVSLDENFNTIWSKSYGLGAGERGFNAVSLPNGNMLVAGFGSSGSSSLLLEITADGELVSSVGFGSFHDRLDLIMKTNDNGFLYHGELEGIIPGNNKVTLMKYDSELNLQWNFYYDYRTSDDYNPQFEMYMRHVLQLEDDGYIILASYAQFTNPSLSRKIRLIKVDAEGNLQWVKGYHGGNLDNAIHISQTLDSGFIISATSDSYGSGDTDILLIKTDSNGNTQWLKTYGGMGDEIAGEILQWPNGDYVICGSTNSFGFGKYDAMLFSTDTEGNLKTARTYGEAEDDFATKVDRLGEGFLISGTSNSYSDGNIDVYVIRTSLTGALDECSFDATSLLFEKSVNTTFFEGSYSQDTFGSPSNTFLNESDVISSQMNVGCTECFESTVQNMVLCPNDTINLNYVDGDGLTFSWQDGSSRADFEVTQPGIYWVDRSDGRCMYRDSVLVSELDATIDFGEDVLLCQGDSLTLSASMIDGQAFTWQDGSTSSTYSVDQPGIYWVDITDSGCTYRDTVQVSTFNATIDFGEDVHLCEGDTLTLSASMIDGQAFAWQDGSTSSSYFVNQPGIYWVDISDTECTYRDTVQVSSFNSTLDLGEDVRFCNGDNVLLSAAMDGAQTYTWQDGSTAPTYLVNQPGRYSVMVTTECGTFEEAIEISGPEEAFIPNVFTPNGDGVNDYFELRPESEPFELEVVTRTGEVVYSSSLYQNDWNGENVSAGVYYYLIRNKCSNRTYQSWLQIIK